MMNRLFNLAFGAIIGQFLKDKVREGSIKAVKGYIQAVKGARLALMGLFGIGAVASILVTGFVLMIVGIVGLLPIEAVSKAVTVLVIGILLFAITGIGLLIAFSQKRWLEMSRSYDLMDAVLSPWPGMLPPNPVDVMKGRGPHPSGSYAPMAPSGPLRSSENPAVVVRTEEADRLVHSESGYGSESTSPRQR